MEKKRLIFTAIAALSGLAFILLPGYTELQKMRDEKEEYEKRIALLQESNEDLLEELEKLSTDPEYLEKKARTKLGIVKKGEIVYRSSTEGGASD